LVACLDVGSTVGKSTIQVSLRCVLDESDESNKLREDEISIECCLIVINEDGELIHQTPDEMSSSPASSDKNAIVSFNIDLIDVSKFSYVIIPTSLHVINLDQCLLRSSQIVTESDCEQAKLSHEEYLRELKEMQQAKKKKFKCDLCDFRAMTAVGLKKHLNKQHPYPD